jgi:hypothetical protein
MVPHLAVEEAINMELGAADGDLLAVVTAVPDRVKGERLIVFHLPTDHDPKEVVRRLGEHGLPNLWVPGADAFAEIAELPMLGSGKLDLKHLAEMPGSACGCTVHQHADHARDHRGLGDRLAMADGQAGVFVGLCDQRAIHEKVPWHGPHRLENPGVVGTRGTQAIDHAAAHVLRVKSKARGPCCGRLVSGRRPACCSV